MTTKLNLNTLVRLQKEFAEIYRTSALCSINDYGVHVHGVDNLRSLAPADCELVTKWRGEIEYPYETWFVYDGVKFYAIRRGDS